MSIQLPSPPPLSDYPSSLLCLCQTQNPFVDLSLREAPKFAVCNTILVVLQICDCRSIRLSSPPREAPKSAVCRTIPTVLQIYLEKNDVARLISTILDGTNYITWAHQMRSFLIGRKLWRIVTGDITKPVKSTIPVKNTGKNNTEHNDANTSDIIVHETTTEDIKYIERLEDWDSKNHQIITWLEYESVHAALLHRNPLPSLDTTVQEILFEEKRLGIISFLPFDVALATAHLRQANETSFCKNYKLHGYKFTNCPTIEYRYCYKRSHILDNCLTHPPRPSGHSHKPKFSLKAGSSSVVVVAATSFDITAPSSLQLTNLHDLLK
ncbi:Zinc finger, CCHC-type [Cucumis melo var. makuwa]|uniref:Zinc finger, CCHC-type n=1 Tax=Cucumis melo var. makuwa TaxID=1194695 RepID=A0A5A7VJS5_CUCMM|nr:Zinc finger, CCHC-type [Cucumis melo var. makuwa]